MQSLVSRAFIEPFHRLAEQLGRVVPAVVTVAVILLVGGFVAWIVRHGVYRLLVLARFDRLAMHTRAGAAIERSRLFGSPSDFGARLIQGSLWLLILLLALSATDSQLMQELATRFVNYIPDLVTAALVLLIGAAVSKFLARSALLAAVNAQWAGARLLAGGVRVFVMSLAVVIALEQLRIGRAALLVTFAILFAGVVLAAAVAFGLGARDLAKDWLQSKTKTQPHPPEEEEEVFRHL